MQGIAMNYEKKRKRQNGRQKDKPTYKIWLDEYCKIHATIEKKIQNGILPPINFVMPPHL